MSGLIKLWCWVQGDDVQRLFRVQIGLSDTIFELKLAILAMKSSFKGVSPDSLTLWKFEQPLESFNTDVIKLEDGQLLTPWKRISVYWKDEPKEDVLSVILPRPAGTTITPSSSQNSNLSQKSVPSWLAEIHEKLWGRRDLFDQIFRTVNLTKTDFIELQGQLQSLNPSRNSESYQATRVLDTKAEFLRSRSFVDIDTATHFAKYDAGTNGDLVPQLIVNTSKDLTPPVAADVDDALDTDTLDVDAGTGAVDDAMDVDADDDSIVADAAYLSEGSAAIFPCTIRYMDLTVLELEHLNRVPHLMLIRDEWKNVVDIFNDREKGILGSAVFTGQPGTGKTCFMYYILILCIIRAQPIVFQDTRTQVFLINDEVRHQGDTVEVLGKDVLALVDADMEFCIPSQYLLDCTNLRILLTSSPRLRADRKWLTQYVVDSNAAFVMEPWSQGELLVTSLFLARIDITLGRFRATTRICGYIPRQCFEAAVSPAALSIATQKIIAAIQQTPDLANAISNVHTKPIHRAFEIYPSPEIKNWDCCLARPVSDWAACQMVAELERKGADAAFDFYQMMKGYRDSAPLVGKLFETKVHKFFRSITEPRSFQIYSLDDHSITFNIEFSSGTSHQTFGANQEFAGQLASCVKNSNSCYLKPLSPIFPTFDSFLYQHEMSRPGCQPLIGIQVTVAPKHDISIKGLAALQTCLKPKVPELKALRPSTAMKWIMLFVVPEPMVASFVKQPFKDAGKVVCWDKKVTQYVLGLPEREVLRS